ncbi:unnamed protein product, partial [Tuber aestivum]
ASTCGGRRVRKARCSGTEHDWLVNNPNPLAALQLIIRVGKLLEQRAARLRMIKARETCAWLLPQPPLRQPSPNPPSSRPPTTEQECPTRKTHPRRRPPLRNAKS